MKIISSLNRTLLAISAGAAIVISSCAPFGPDHLIPESERVEFYKTANQEYTARTGEKWWTIFNDSKLNSLISSLEKGSFDLRAAEARRIQAYSTLGLDRTQLYPALSGSGSATRNRISENDFMAAQGGPAIYYNQYRVGLSLSYELDLWGRVRRLIESSRAETAAAEVTVDQVKLSLQSQLASSYFAMRFLDSEAAVLNKSLTTRRESLKLAKELFEGGSSSELDVARAEVQLTNAEAQLISLEGPRASLENSIAVLIGKNPSNFSISPSAITRNAPRISAGTPASLLGRRPDVFIAERTLAAASAQIGVTEAKFYPKLSLIGSSGLSSLNSSTFLQFSSSQFAIGPEIELPVIQGNRRDAAVNRSQARQREALAQYQQTVLSAFADVENALVDRRSASREMAALKKSVTASQRAFDLSNTRYKEGVASYLEVIDSQRELLSSERSEVQARGRSFAATVRLIQALGGGFRR